MTPSPIDVFLLRGTGETLGVPGMCHGVTRRLATNGSFRIVEVPYPATIGRIGVKQGEQAYALDASVDIAVDMLARAIRESPNRAGIVSYSLGGIAATRFLEQVAAGVHRNTNAKQTPLDIAFAVNIANPARAAGDSVVPAPGYGLHSSHGPFPKSTVVYELANPHDIICSAPADSPVRRIAGALSPYAALELRQAAAFDDVKDVRSRDWLRAFRPGRYTEAVVGLGGYLLPYGRPGRTQHTLYALENMPGENTTWTDWAAAEINRGWAIR